MLYLLCIMKRLLLLSFTLLNSILGYAQIKCDFIAQSQELNFSYKDSLDGIVTLGNYEPCGLLKVNDSSFIIAADISIYFNSPDKDLFKKSPDVYYRELDTVIKKEFIPRGKIIEVDENLHKKWIQSFSDEIIGIVNLYNNSFLVIKDNYENRILIDDIDANGHTLWSKSYGVKRMSIFNDIKTDKSGNTYILVESDKINFLKLNTIYNKLNLKIFKKYDDCRDENKIHLIKISPKGDKLFDKIISNNKHHGVDYSLVIDSSQTLFIQFGILNEYVRKGKYHEDSWNTLNKYNKHGKIEDTSNQCVHIIDNDRYVGDISCYFKHDTFYISRWYFKKEIPIDSIEINGPFSKRGGYSIGKCRLIKSENGFLLICDISGRYLFCLLDKNLHFRKYYLYDEISKMMLDSIIDVFKMKEGELIMLNKNVITLLGNLLYELSTKAQLLKLNYDTR